jgi:hypothetical protein
MLHERERGPRDERRRGDANSSKKQEHPHKPRHIQRDRSPLGVLVLTTEPGGRTGRRGPGSCAVSRRAAHRSVTNVNGVVPVGIVYGTARVTTKTGIPPKGLEPFHACVMSYRRRPVIMAPAALRSSSRISLLAPLRLSPGPPAVRCKHPLMQSFPAVS